MTLRWLPHPRRPDWLTCAVGPVRFNLYPAGNFPLEIYLDDRTHFGTHRHESRQSAERTAADYLTKWVAQAEGRAERLAADIAAVKAVLQ